MLLPHFLYPTTEQDDKCYDNSNGHRNFGNYYWKQTVSLYRFQSNTLRLWYTFWKWCIVTSSARIDLKCHFEVDKVITLYVQFINRCSFHRFRYTIMDNISTSDDSCDPVIPITCLRRLANRWRVDGEESPCPQRSSSVNGVESLYPPRSPSVPADGIASVDCSLV